MNVARPVAAAVVASRTLIDLRIGDTVFRDLLERSRWECFVRLDSAQGSVILCDQRGPLVAALQDVFRSVVGGAELEVSVIAASGRIFEALQAAQAAQEVLPQLRPEVTAGAQEVMPQIRPEVTVDAAPA
jgi:hypothetical protein